MGKVNKLRSKELASVVLSNEATEFDKDGNATVSTPLGAGTSHGKLSGGDKSEFDTQAALSRIQAAAGEDVDLRGDD